MSEYLEFAARGKNAWWRYGLGCIAAFVLTMLAVAVLAVVLTLLHLRPPDFAAQFQHPKDAPSFFLGIAVVFGLLTLSLMAVVAVMQKKRPGDVIGRWRWPLFFWGLGVWAAVQGVLTLVDFLISPRGFSLSVSGGTAVLAVCALIGMAVQTFCEEFIFRGYLTQGILLALKKPLPAAIVSGLLFGALHISNGVPQAIGATAFGIVCALIAIRTGGIALTFGLHLANNYFDAVAVVSTSDVFKGSPGLISQNTPQLAWWDVCVGVLALAGLLWLVWKFPDSARGARILP